MQDDLYTQGVQGFDLVVDNNYAPIVGWKRNIERNNVQVHAGQIKSLALKEGEVIRQRGAKIRYPPFTLPV